MLDFPGLNEDSLPVPLVTFLGVLTAYPQAGIGIIVRNFNTIEPDPERPDSRMSVYLYAYVGDENVGTDHVNLSRVFPKSLMDELRSRRIEGNGAVGFGAFLDLGQTIADTLKREVTIVHQYGGNMEYASYDNYAPFTPGGDGKIEVIKTTGPAFLG